MDQPSTEFRIGTALTLIAIPLGLIPAVFTVSPFYTTILRLLCIVCIAAGFFIFAYFIPWRRFVRVAIIVFGFLAGYRVLFPPPTYIYLFPGRGLGENSTEAPREMIHGASL
jgi:hypothetical protein